MSITDELREWMYSNTIDCSNKRMALSSIVCRIDAALAERYVERPKDADGEYIHVGDEMCGYGWPNGGVYCRAIVNEVTILVGPQDSAYRGWLMWAANECRHHHATTVEDVLREMLDAWGELPSNVTNEAIVAEYAAKLRLAGGDV